MIEYKHGDILASFEEITCKRCKKLKVVNGGYCCGNDPVDIDVNHKCEEFEEYGSIR